MSILSSCEPPARNKKGGKFHAAGNVALPWLVVDPALSGGTNIRFLRCLPVRKGTKPIIAAKVSRIKVLQFVGWTVDGPGVVIDSTKGGNGASALCRY